MCSCPCVQQFIFSLAWSWSKNVVVEEIDVILGAGQFFFFTSYYWLCNFIIGQQNFYFQIAFNRVGSRNSSGKLLRSQGFGWQRVESETSNLDLMGFTWQVLTMRSG